MTLTTLMLARESAAPSNPTGEVAAEVIVLKASGAASWRRDFASRHMNGLKADLPAFFRHCAEPEENDDEIIGST